MVVPIAYQYIHSKTTAKHKISTGKGGITAVTCKQGIDSFCLNPNPGIHFFTKKANEEVLGFPWKSRIKGSSTTMNVKSKFHLLI